MDVRLIELMTRLEINRIIYSISLNIAKISLQYHYLIKIK